MRFLLLLFISCSVFSATYSQIPNNSFEDWSELGGYSLPENWGNLNNYTSSFDVYTCTKGSPGNPGSSYLKLTSRLVGAIGIVPGIAVSGKLDSISLEPIEGFAFAARPEKLEGNWQHMIYGASQGYIDVKLTRWDSASNSAILVANGHKPLTGMAMSWASFTVNLEYFDDAFPDTCIIVMAASGDAPTNNDYLYVDDLQFTGENVPTSIDDLSVAQILSIYPNPTSDYIFVDFDSSIDCPLIKIIDGLGRLYYPEIIWESEGSCQIDVSVLSSGSYYLLSEFKSYRFIKL